MTDDEIRDIFAEFQRVGVDLGRPPGLALGTGFRDGELLAWLRGLPDGLGHDAFVENLNAFIAVATPNVVLLEDGEPVPSPRRYSPTIEQVHAACDILSREWDPLGARLGELTRDDVAIPAYNAVFAIIQGGPTRNVEALVAAKLRGTEREVYGVRAAPLIQTRYLVRRIMQAVAAHPGPPHEFDPFERLRNEALQADTAETAASGGRAHQSRRRTVSIGPRRDEPVPLDPNASCSECGATGTVAYVTRDVDPRLSRYCADCWRKVRHRHSWFPETTHERDSPEAMIAAFEHIYEHVRDPWVSAGSALWDDQLFLIRKVLEPDENVTPANREAHLKWLATELVNRAPRMHGPMPPDIEAFVQQYGGLDA